MHKYLIVLLVIASSTSYAAANKWIDAQGKVHYSDQSPPAHAKSQSTLNINTPEVPVATSGVSGVPATSNPAPNNDAVQNAAAAKKAAADKAAFDAAMKEAKQANCAAAKQNLANLKDGIRIVVADPTTGERSYLDDAQRQKSMDESQQQVDKSCQ